MVLAKLIGIVTGLTLLVSEGCTSSKNPHQAAGQVPRQNSGQAQLEPLSLEPAFPNLAFQQPVFATSPKDGSQRLFVVEQDGLIRVFRNSGNPASAKTFLDLRTLVNSPADGGGAEEGLLGLAFDPQYGTNGEFYVYYSAAEPRRNVLARYRVSDDPDVADITSGTVLLQIPKPFSNHNGGALAFGSDGMLYISVGDGGSAGDPQDNGQNKNTLLGKILRIDPKTSSPYAIPPDNPFVREGQGVRGEIWAYGLRNPWRMSFDRRTGELWLGDAGQNSWEEIDRVKKGDNLGWSVFEGTHAFKNPNNLSADNFVGPVLDYPNDDTGGHAVIGGYVYRGNRLPALQGRYLYGDFVSGRIWALQPETRTTTQVAQLAGLSAFGEDAEGELYLINYGDGKLYRFKQ